MRGRSIVALVLLAGALVSGGWFMARGTSNARMDGPARERLFAEVFAHLKRDYVDTLSDSTLYRRAIDGALRELHDPHSVFLDTRRLSRLDESTSGHYAGVGIQMDVRDSGISVIATLPGTPAEQAGIITGDRIVAIEGKSTTGVTSDEALKTLRGAAGSTVHVSIARPGFAERLPFTLVRREILVNPVRHALSLGNGIGYVDLTVFSAAAATDLAHAIDSLRATGVKSLVLDLRGDPGGLLDQGVDVADLFLDPGQSIVSTRGRGAAETRSFADHAQQKWGGMPLVVLTDSGSASASEIVAGALQDHDRAVVVGTATYGKGSAQRVFRVDNGAIKLTTALWYTPSGRSIDRPREPVVDDDGAPAVKPDSAKARPKFHTDGGRVVLGGGGIVPDIEVAKRPGSPADRALQRALGAKVPQFVDVIVEYALAEKAAHALANPGFDVTPAMRDALYGRLKARGIIVPRAVYDSANSLVTRAMTTQLSRYVFGGRAEFERTLRQDPTMLRAETLLHGVDSQKALLARVGSPQAK
ncbi:MAG: S41 family peptidase [bacterium]